MNTNNNPQIKKNSIYSNNTGGFTLIELMVVLMVIAILAAIAIPSYRTFAVRNAQSEVQAIMQNQSVQLKKWRAKALSYRGYEEHEILVPSGSTAQNYNYKITIVDGQETSKSLNTTTTNSDGETEFDVNGQSWMMLATPNPSGRFKNANIYFVSSSGERCYVDHSNASSLVLQDSPKTDCSGAGTESW